MHYLSNNAYFYAYFIFLCVDKRIKLLRVAPDILNDALPKYVVTIKLSNNIEHIALII